MRKLILLIFLSISICKSYSQSIGLEEGFLACETFIETENKNLFSLKYLKENEMDEVISMLKDSNIDYKIDSEDFGSGYSGTTLTFDGYRLFYSSMQNGLSSFDLILDSDSSIFFKSNNISISRGNNFSLENFGFPERYSINSKEAIIIHELFDLNGELVKIGNWIEIEFSKDNKSIKSISYKIEV